MRNPDEGLRPFDRWAEEEFVDRERFPSNIRRTPASQRASLLRLPLLALLEEEVFFGRAVF
jgi:hypothetical protein